MPQSWKSRPFTQAITRLKSHGGRLKTSQYRLKGSLPIVDQGATLIIGYTEQRACVFQGPYPVVVFGDHTRNVKLYQHEFAVGGEGVVLLRPRDEDELSTEFMYYWLKHVRLPDLGYSRHFKVLKEQVISFPSSIEEQRRIVSNIEAMTRRTEEARRLRQEAAEHAKAFLSHAYSSVYRGLCTVHGTVPLISTGKVIGGGTPTRKNGAFWSGNIPWISPKNMKSWKVTKSSECITHQAIENSSTKLVPSPAVLFVVRGMVLQRNVPVAISSCPLAINQDMKAIAPNDSFDAEFLASMIFGAESVLLGRVGTAGHGTKKLETNVWASLPIPKPSSIEEQRRIVPRLSALRSKLDDFLGLQNEVDSKLAEFTPALLDKAFRGEL